MGNSFRNFRFFFVNGKHLVSQLFLQRVSWDTSPSSSHLQHLGLLIGSLEPFVNLGQSRPRDLRFLGQWVVPRRDSGVMEKTIIS